MSAPASICDGEQNARAKRKERPVGTTRRKRFANEERERIGRGTCDEEGETLRRFLPRSNTGGTKQKKTETGPPTVPAHTKRTWRCTSARNEKKNYGARAHIFVACIFEHTIRMR